MKVRQVFCTDDLASAQAAMFAARGAGFDDDGISLIARSDIEMSALPNERLDTSTDMLPSALRGMGIGGAMGLIGGVGALFVPLIGMTGAGVVLVTLVGATVGAFSAALVGCDVPNHVRRKFEREIDAGRILVVVDDDRSRELQVREAIRHAGATPLQFHDASMLS